MAGRRLSPAWLIFGALASTLGGCQLLLDFDRHDDRSDGGAPPSGSGYVRVLTIKASDARALDPGLTVRVPLDALAAAVDSGKVRRDYADLRVLGPSGEVHRVVDTKPVFTSDALWIALSARIDAGATDTSYSLVYGASTGTAPLADGARVFRLFDQFESGPLAPMWLSNGEPTVDRGVLLLRALHDDAITTRDGQVAATSTFEARVRVLAREADAGAGTHYWLGFQRQGDFATDPPWALWNSRTPTTIRPEVDEANVGPQLAQTAEFRVYEIDRDARTTSFSLDGTPQYGADYTNDVALSPMLRNYGSGNDIEIDWVRVRTRLSPEPTVTVGREQPVGSDRP